MLATQAALTIGNAVLSKEHAVQSASQLLLIPMILLSAGVNGARGAESSGTVFHGRKR
jgi:hypothetical protein